MLIERVTDPVAEFLETYGEWRYVYGINDPRISELKTAIVAHSGSRSLTSDQVIKLQSLVRLIEHEQAALLVNATQHRQVSPHWMSDAVSFPN
jgi:hypothetical protein